MNIFKSALIQLSGNEIIQNVLQYNVKISQILMGIGSGSGVLSSGEGAIFQILRQKCVPPFCIFDIGSNQGEYVKLVMKNLLIEDYSLHCFEPGPDTFNLLVKNVKDIKNIKLNNIGISKEKGEASLYFNKSGSGLASLSKRRLDHFGIDFNKTEKIKLDTIDNYCFENTVNHIHLLKIDIEGHELDALLGACKMFEKKQIDIVTFEFGGCNIDSRTYFQDYWYFFREINMKIFRITKSGYLFPIKCYSEIHEQFRTTNYLAMN
ncbi:MAG: FkbM family methyltransferase [Bacteroidota bacterium]